MAPGEYPRWISYPLWSKPPEWAPPLVEAFRKHRQAIDSTAKSPNYLKSDGVLSELRADLEHLGFEVEKGKDSQINRPVYFEEFGKAARSYKIDSYHEGLKIGLEVEAGRATKGNAIYRDIIQTSLLVGVENFAMAVPQTYHYSKTVEPSYKITKSVLDAIYSSERFRLPFEAVLLIGY